MNEETGPGEGTLQVRCPLSKGALRQRTQATLPNSNAKAFLRGPVHRDNPDSCALYACQYPQGQEEGITSRGTGVIVSSGN